MATKTVLALVIYLAVITFAAVLMRNLRLNLFHAGIWGLIGAVAAGIIAGTIRGLMKRIRPSDERTAPRHSVPSFMEHWGTAAGIFVLMASGWLLGISFLPHSSSNPLMSKNIHYLGAWLILGFGFFFIADMLVSGEISRLVPGFRDVWNGTILKYVFRKKWPATGKYLSSQKSAFAVFCILCLAVAVTGIIKASILAFPVSFAVIRASTTAHDIAAVLLTAMVVIHVLLAVLPSNLPRLASWFTGRNVDDR